MILKSRNNVILFTFLALSSVVGTNAFVKPSTNGVSKLSTEVSAKDPISPEPIFPFLDNIYGEESRLYRRTVFTHDDWKRFRSPDRFMRNLSTFTKSGIYTNILREVLATTAVATFVVLWNAVAGGYTDFDGTKHAALFTNTLLGPLTLSLAPFSLSSPSLGLLLGMLSKKNSKKFYFRPVRLNILIDETHLLSIFLSLQCSAPTLLTNVGMKHEKTGE